MCMRILYSSAMFVYFNRLLFKSISLLSFLHFIIILPFFPLLPFISLLPFPLLPFLSAPLLPSFPFYAFFFSCNISSPFPPIPSSLIPPLLSFRSLLSLLLLLSTHSSLIIGGSPLLLSDGGSPPASPASHLAGLLRRRDPSTNPGPIAWWVSVGN